MKRIVLGVQYDGTPWLGYQTQPHGETVQDKLEAALLQFTRQEVHTICAGRTDAGVHALEQVVHFDIDLSRNAFSWVRGTNAYLPPSIAVRWAAEVEPDPAFAAFDPAGAGSATFTPEPGLPGLPDLTKAGMQHEFHSRFSATARTYHYLLYNSSIHSPLLRNRVGWVFRPLDADRMQQAANYLLGVHDFSAFRAAHCQAKTPVKLMHEIRVERRGDMIVFTLRASAFLHHMVRNIVGSLIVVGTGNQPPEWMEQILAGKDRSKAAPTFMPDGLYLARIDYDPKWGLPQQPNVLPWL